MDAASTPPIAFRLQDVKHELASHQAQLESFGVRQLHLFGSTVHDQATSESDLDFLVTLQPKTFHNYMNLKFYLEDIFGRPVDLVTPESLKPALRTRILDEAKRVV